MTNHPEYDVVVAGYGLAGECATSLLARLGHRVCAFERWPTLYGLPRTVSTDGEGTRILDKTADLEQALRSSSEIYSYEIVDVDRRPITAMTWSRDKVCGFHNRTSFYQPYVEEAMDKGARAHGAEVNQGWEVTDAVRVGDLVEVTVREHAAVGEPDLVNPAERKLTTRYLIGADGARSNVRAAIDTEWEYFDYNDAWLSMDVLRKRPIEQLDPHVATQIISTDRVIAAIPIGTERIRFEFLLGGDPSDHQDLSEEAGYEFLDSSWGLGRDDVEIYRQVVYPFEGRMAKEWRQGPIFLVGDAAHLMPPFTGMGAVSAFRDSANLAWKLDMVMKDRAPESLLETYQVERGPNVLGYIQLGVEIGRMSTITDPDAAAARDAALRAGGAPPPQEPEYDFGILEIADGQPVRPAGLKEPQGVVSRDGQEGLYDDVVGWGFSLLLRGEDPAALLDEAQLAFLERIGCNAVQLGRDEGAGIAVELDDEYERFFAEHDIVGYIGRPDFRVFAGIRSTDDVPRLVDELERHLMAGAVVAGGAS
jgi:3-(3-hydroxy-phenyl)propionate hydroxylase